MEDDIDDDDDDDDASLVWLRSEHERMDVRYMNIIGGVFVFVFVHRGCICHMKKDDNETLL